VSLIQKKATPRLRTANRANSLKSTGPRTKLGKVHSSRNAIKSGVFSKLPVASMKELGEEPAAFERLRESLRRTFGPRDGFEQMLVEDMAEIRWRRQRLMRAEAGIVASQKRKFEIEREWKVADYGKGLGAVANDMLAADMGLAALHPSGSNFADITESLQALKYSVESKGFKEEDSFLLKLVYGEKACYKGRYLINLFNRGCEEAQDESGKSSDEVETTRRVFLETLDKEIASFSKLAELHYARDVEVTEPLKDSHLIPSQEDLDKIMRYEAALERQFERKVQQLVAWRRAKGEPSPGEIPEL
jgi:hypothetical protein